MMVKEIIFTETVLTTVEPERTLRTADESLIDIRVVESIKEASGWVYEYEVSGEMGKIKKFLCRIKNLESLD